MQMKLERSKQERSVQQSMEAQEKTFGRITRSLSGACARRSGHSWLLGVAVTHRSSVHTCPTSVAAACVPPQVHSLRHKQCAAFSTCDGEL